MNERGDINQFILAGIIVVCLIIILILFVELRKLRKNGTTSDHLKAGKIALQVQDLDSFRYKLNPHLLKNALNAIQSHAYQSYYALDKLSNVLDYILYESDGGYVLLKDELQFAFNLIEINRLKTSPLFDLHIRNKIDADKPLFRKLKIAPFITINPIENAFKHADLQSDDAFISVIFDLSDDWFFLSVSNKIPAGSMHQQKGGIGNKAFEDRLQTLYGTTFELKEESDGNVYTTHLKIKLHADI